MIDLNEEQYESRDIQIFNDGNAGSVDNVDVRVEKKGAGVTDNTPDYKLVISDEKGEINEGFYYQKSLDPTVADEDSPGWKNYQARKLRALIKGVMGEDFEIPPFNTPTEGLDTIMQIVAKNVAGKKFRVFATYGTTRRPSQYLQLKSFGNFVERMSNEDTNLKAERSDLLERPEVGPTSSSVVDAATSEGGVPWEANS